MQQYPAKGQDKPKKILRPLEQMVIDVLLRLVRDGLVGLGNDRRDRAPGSFPTKWVVHMEDEAPVKGSGKQKVICEHAEVV